jgi:hypothetical protein
MTVALRGDGHPSPAIVEDVVETAPCWRRSKSALRSANCVFGLTRTLLDGTALFRVLQHRQVLLALDPISSLLQGCCKS